MGYPVWGFRIEKKSPDFRSPEVGISVRSNFETNGIPYKQLIIEIQEQRPQN